MSNRLVRVSGDLAVYVEGLFDTSNATADIDLEELIDSALEYRIKESVVRAKLRGTGIRIKQLSAVAYNPVSFTTDDDVNEDDLI